MIITYNDIKRTSNKRLKAFFLQTYGMLGKTTVKELLKLDGDKMLGFAPEIFALLRLSGVCQVYYPKERKLRIWAKYENGRAVKYNIYDITGKLIKTKRRKNNE